MIRSPEAEQKQALHDLATRDAVEKAAAWLERTGAGGLLTLRDAETAATRLRAAFGATSRA